MKLYIATNGYHGFGPVQCYVWANDETEALELATESYKKSEEAESHGERYWENIELQLIVDSEVDKESFSTVPTD